MKCMDKKPVDELKKEYADTIDKIIELENKRDKINKLIDKENTQK